jgi:hypothetical protein
MIRRALYLSAIVLAACSVDPGSDRPGTLAEGIAIDSVRFLPIGSRFVLRDSASPIAFLGYHAGYVCSRFLRLGLADALAGVTPAYRPETQVRFPASDECALDSGGRDTTVAHVFSGEALIRLANPLGQVTDSALPIPGKMGFDSIRGFPDSTGALSIGNVTFRDSTASGIKEVRIDSLPQCRFLNSADWEKSKGDTVMIRFSWVDLDPAAVADACQGPLHSDSSVVGPHRTLRMAVPITAK